MVSQWERHCKIQQVLLIPFWRANGQGDEKPEGIQCLAQVEPEGFFSIEGTLWGIYHPKYLEEEPFAFIEFSDGEIYFPLDRVDFYKADGLFSVDSITF